MLRSAENGHDKADDFFEGKRIIVTGAAGTVGTELVNWLLRTSAAEVRGIDSLICGRLDNLRHLTDNPRFRFIKRDVRELSADDPACAGATYFFHFAGIGDIVPSIEKPVE